MEKTKKELKETYREYMSRGFSPEEALSQTIREVREKHEKEKFLKALEEFLKEIAFSYKPENLTEIDPVFALVEYAYAEYELLKEKAKELFRKK